MSVSVGNTIKDALMGTGPWVVIGDVEVSASLSENHKLEADVTDYPVETGSTVSDHYHKKPPTVTIQGIVSDVNLETGYPGQTAVEAFRTFADGNPAMAAWQNIELYFDTSVLVTIVTSLKTYEKMGLTSFTVDRLPGKADSLRFTVTAREMRIVSTETTAALDIPEPPDPKNKSAKGNKKDKGKQQPTDANNTQADGAKSKSAGATMFDGFFG